MIEPQIVGIGGVDGIGKSLFLKSLAGLVPKSFYAGRIDLCDKQIEILSASRRRRLGIYYISDQISWLENFSIHQNLQFHFGRISKKDLAEFLNRLSEIPELTKVKANLMPALTSEEILFIYLKFLEWNRPKLILFDNPVANFSKKWQERFNHCLYNIKSKSCHILYALPAYLDAMPKLDTVFWLDEKDLTYKKITDEETKTVRVYTSQSTNEAAVFFPAKNSLVLNSQSMKVQLNEIDLDIRPGEILGVFYRGDSEEGPELKSSFKASILKAKKRQRSLFSRLRGSENITLSILDDLKNFRSFEKKSKELGDYYGSLFRWPSQNFVSDLSKMQITKLLLSKALIKKPQILFFHHASRGLSLNDRKELYQWIRQLSDSGLALLWLSDEIEELARLSHRVLALMPPSHQILDSNNLTDNKKLIEAINSLKENRGSLLFRGEKLFF